MTGRVNESELLFALTILNYSAAIAKKILIDCLLIDLSSILTIEKGNGSLI